VAKLVGWLVDEYFIRTGKKFNFRDYELGTQEANVLFRKYL